MGEQAILGFADMMMKQDQNAKAEELRGIQMQHLKTTSKAAEIALKMEQQKEILFDSLSPEQKMAVSFPKADDSLESKLQSIMKFFGGGAKAQPVPLPPYDPGAPGPPTGPTRPGAMSLPETIAGMQGGGGLLPGGLTMDDVLRGVMKKELGAESPKYMRTAPVVMPGGKPGTAPVREDGLIDLSKAVAAPYKLDTQKGVGEGMVPTETPVDPYNRQPVGVPIQTGPPPTMQMDTPTAGGGKVRSVVPLFPGGSKVTGTRAGGIRTELDLVDTPIPASDTLKWSDGAGNNPPAGWTPRQAQARGFKQTPEGMAAESGGKAVMVAQALQDIEAAEKMFFPRPGVFNRKLAVSAQMGLPEWMAEGSQTAVSMMMNAASAKLRIETGATARPEEQKDVIARFVPSWKDNEKSALGKMTRFKEFMRAGKFVLDPKGRIVVVEPTKGKPDLSLGKKKDPAKMTNAEIMAELGKK